jgi:glyoxylase-like metal-dependent hydrolase (beta-lactamase superfamily II)
VDEHGLSQLGIWRIPVPIPFVQAGGPVNVYLLEEEDGGLCLFDSGLGSDEARAALDEGFRRLGRHHGEIRRIVVSHGHVDHYGNAQSLVERAGGGIPVYAHAADIGKIAESGVRWRDRMAHYGAFFARMGVPPEVMAVVAEESGRGQKLARRIREVRAVGEGDRLRFRHFEAELLHMPGHTPGLLCLWIPEHRILLADDHLLEKVSPNPIIELGPDGEEDFFRPLVAYLASVRRLRDMEVEWILPGHGPPFGEHRRVIDALIGFYERRQLRIRELLAGGPLTAYQVVTALFPRARPGDTFLALSEALANLELLEGRGEVERDDEGGACRFRLAS